MRGNLRFPLMGAPSDTLQLGSGEHGQSPRSPTLAVQLQPGVRHLKVSDTGFGPRYGWLSRDQRLSRIRLTGQNVAEPPKSSAPAAKTFAPAGVS